MKTSLDLKMIAAAGGSIIIDATPYTSLDLKLVASALKDDATLLIKNANKFSSLDCKTIVSGASGKVTFDFS